MLVERKTRCNPHEHNSFGKSGNAKKSSRLRFHDLTSLNMDELGSDLGNDDNSMGSKRHGKGIMNANSGFYQGEKSDIGLRIEHSSSCLDGQCIGQSKGTGYALGPGGDFADLLEGKSIYISSSSGGKVQKIVGLKETDSVVPLDVLSRRVCGVGDIVTFFPASFNSKSSIHFNLALENLSLAHVVVNEGVINTRKDTIIIFQENSNSNLTKVNVDNEAIKSGMSSIPIKGWDSGGKVMGSKRALDSSWVSLTGSMLLAMDLISSELDGQVVKETGYANSKFARIFHEYSNEYKPDIINLLESRINGFKFDAIIAKLGLKRSHRVEAVGFSGGIWLGWKKFIDVEKRRLLWKDLRLFIPSRHFLWMAIGDFNAILSVEEKKGGQVAGQTCSFFGEFVDRTKVYDLGFKGSPFTWHRGALFERLDRALGNDAWLEVFLNCLVTYLLRIKLDPRPILLILQSYFSLPKANKENEASVSKGKEKIVEE
ncbi:hypothetical protein CXB51_007058 [Gossypium anomalum]|uniref:Uncharacterized protein n=1 Tax=Gossypium anomalum TaxID=47600 RepID=A0A8J6D4L9_9ROSI|nr:hypothetical protein CXB51_007058 [Gossypium anomalum]